MAPNAVIYAVSWNDRNEAYKGETVEAAVNWENVGSGGRCWLRFVDTDTDETLAFVDFDYVEAGEGGNTVLSFKMPGRDVTVLPQAGTNEGITDTYAPRFIMLVENGNGVSPLLLIGVVAGGIVLAGFLLGRK